MSRTELISKRSVMLTFGWSSLNRCLLLRSLVCSIRSCLFISSYASLGQLPDGLRRQSFKIWWRINCTPNVKDCNRHDLKPSKFGTISFYCNISHEHMHYYINTNHVKQVALSISRRLYFHYTITERILLSYVNMSTLS